jgi:hypothetical protein
MGRCQASVTDPNATHRASVSLYEHAKHCARRCDDGVFAQILGKSDFFKLGENLRRILLDYAEKRASTANVPFNRPC